MESQYAAHNEALARLNNQQRRAVTETEGPVLLLAGPGTGKTEVLSVRIGQILRETDIYPSNILCLTFSNAAVDAMRSRLGRLIGESTAQQIHIHTFHGFSNQLLQTKNNGNVLGKRLISDAQKQMLIEQLIYEQFSSIDPSQLKPASAKKTKSLSSIFTILRQEGISRELLLSYADYCIKALLPYEQKYLTKKGIINAEGKRLEQSIRRFTNEIFQLYDQYNSILIDRGLIDYDDMLTEALSILQADEAFRSSLHEQYQYILVDEFQDTNQKQLELLNMLISDLIIEPNLFVVGDDDQCVYRFQGAFAKNFDWIRNRFGSRLKTILLDTNYRSTQVILDESFKIIQQNDYRQPEKKAPLQMGNAAYEHIQQPTPVFLQYENAEQEACAIAKDIHEKIISGINPCEIAVLVRRRADLTLIQKWLGNYKVNWQYNQNWLDFLKVYPGIGIFNLVQFLAKYNQQKEYSTPYLIQYLMYKLAGYPLIKQVLEKQEARADDLYLWIKNHNDDDDFREILAAPVIDELMELVEKPITTVTLDLLEQAVFAGMGDATKQRVKVWRNFVEEFLITDKHKTLLSLADMLWYYQQNNIPIKFSDDDFVMDSESVVLSTIHGSKGLEFEVVYVVGCNSNNWEDQSRSGRINVPDLLNRYIAPEAESIDDLRKLLYVAITRAKKHLQLSCYRLSESGNNRVPTNLLEGLNNSGRIVLKKVEVFEYPSIDLEQSVLKFDIGIESLIKDKIDSFELSPTSTGVWTNCQHEFFITQVLKIGGIYYEAPVFGNVIHDVLYSYASAKLDHRKRELVVQLVDQEMNKRKCLFHSTHYNKYVAYAKWLILDYLDRYPITGDKYLLEQTLRMELASGVRIKGKLDRIELGAREAAIVDYKTGRYEQPKEPFQAATNPGTQYWRQAVMYRLLVNNNFNDKERVSFAFHYPERKNTISVCLDDINEPFVKWLEQIWKQTKAGSFSKCSNYACIYCETSRRLSK